MADAGAQDKMKPVKADDPLRTFTLAEIRRETTVGLCIVIGEDMFWVRKAECKWTDAEITMRTSAAKRYFIL